MPAYHSVPPLCSNAFGMSRIFSRQFRVRRRRRTYILLARNKGNKQGRKKKVDGSGGVWSSIEDVACFRGLCVVDCELWLVWAVGGLSFTWIRCFALQGTYEDFRVLLFESQILQKTRTSSSPFCLLPLFRRGTVASVGRSTCSTKRGWIPGVFPRVTAN